MDANENRVRNLPARDLDAIVAMARGMTFAEAGKELGISPSAVKAPTERLKLLLNVRRREEIPYAYWLATGVNPFGLKFSHEKGEDE